MKSAKYIASCNGRQYAAFALLTDALQYIDQRSAAYNSIWALSSRLIDGSLSIATSIHGEFTLTEYGNKLIRNGTA